VVETTPSPLRYYTKRIRWNSYLHLKLFREALAQTSYKRATPCQRNASVDDIP
jgi:hypothetical protein